MTVKGLREILASLPDDARVNVCYYACGSEQKIPLEAGDLNLTKEGIDIDATYN